MNLFPSFAAIRVPSAVAEPLIIAVANLPNMTRLTHVDDVHLTLDHWGNVTPAEVEYRLIRLQANTPGPLTLTTDSQITLYPYREHWVVAVNIITPQVITWLKSFNRPAPPHLTLAHLEHPILPEQLPPVPSYSWDAKEFELLVSNASTPRYQTIQAYFL
jgi:2'-5' RNA ligase